MLDYGDALSFDISTDDTNIRMETPLDGVPDDDNLIVKAARLLATKTKCNKGAVISVDKRLPMGGGIGRGIMNAATTLVALNHLWNTGLSEDELAELGLALGADVPIFVRGLTAFAGGVGEDITPAPQKRTVFSCSEPKCSCQHSRSCSTSPDLPRNTPAIRWEDYKFEKLGMIVSN